MDIPARLYFFPTLYQDMAELVKVDVAKFEQGYWYNETFDVRPGESVGREVEVKNEDETDTRVNPGISPEAQFYARGGRGEMMGLGQVEEPKTIDFSTDVVLVAASRIDGWTGSSSLRPKPYYEMLFSENGVDIERMPIGSTYWPAELTRARNQVNLLMKEPKEDFRSFGSSSLTGLQNTRMGRGETVIGTRGG